jgi:amino acid transporter
MTQESVAQGTTQEAHGADHDAKGSLGPLLCWAVVFADIGTSVYYTPGILYGTVQGLAGFFVMLTMVVFVLLCLKYVEVTHRFPQGGGVVTVAAQAIHPWAGALGGMFILVDYFLTAAISCLSGMLYLSVVFPQLGPPVALWVTIGVLVLLGVLNWVGISESARVSLVGAVIAFFSDIAILITVFSHISFGEFLALFPKMFSAHSLTPVTFLAGFAGAFLAFSGLESISQLSPVMKQPHKKVAGIAMALVVVTVGLTSPLLTMFATLLQPDKAGSAFYQDQLISLLAGHWGSGFLQTEVAISASALLIFASNTAIIGAYHVFMALSRMEFLPSFVLKRNKLRGSPHYSIALATGIPIIILIIVNGNVTTLGDMYAFGLLGAFTLTCLGLDIVRRRDWRKYRQDAKARASAQAAVRSELNGHSSSSNGHQGASVEDLMKPDAHLAAGLEHKGTEQTEHFGLWFQIDFYLGVFTTFLVAIAWTTNLITKPLATIFGGTVTLLGLGVAFINYRQHQRQGQVPVPVVVTHIEERVPDSVLAVLLNGNEQHNEAVIRGAVSHGDSKPIIFLYVGAPTTRTAAPRMMEIIDPYLDDPEAKTSFGKAESLAINAKVPHRRYVYMQGNLDDVTHVWQVVHPYDTVIAAEDSERFKDINPDRVRYELTADGRVAHLLKRWEPVA